MADDESDNGENEEAEEPAVELGEGEPVEGAPIGRITSRLHYPIERSDVLRRESNTLLRTPDGPRELGDIFEAIDATYFEKRADLEGAIRGVVGHGPVPTADE